MNGLDLFSGIGGISIALSPWVRTIAYCENDRYAQSVLLSRMQDGQLFRAPIWDDVSTLNLQNLNFIRSLNDEELDMAGKLKKLTESQVVEDCESYLSGSSLADLAHIYSVTRQSMHDLLKRRIKLRENLKFGKENHFFRGGKRADKRAHDILERATRNGELVNPRVCSICGGQSTFADGRTSIQGHHDDYNKPLDVRWLCQKCHHEWHRHNQPKIYEGGASEPVDIIFGGFP